MPQFLANTILASGVQVTVTSTSTNLTLNTTHYIIKASGGLAGVTITLPAASDGKAEYWIFRSNSSSGNVTVAAVGSDFINAAATAVLSAQYQFCHIVSDGSTLWMRM